jgi:hypothetical protein
LQKLTLYLAQAKPVWKNLQKLTLYLAQAKPVWKNLQKLTLYLAQAKPVWKKSRTEPRFFHSLKQSPLETVYSFGSQNY